MQVLVFLSTGGFVPGSHQPDEVWITACPSPAYLLPHCWQNRFSLWLYSSCFYNHHLSLGCQVAPSGFQKCLRLEVVLAGAKLSKVGSRSGYGGVLL